MRPILGIGEHLPDETLSSLPMKRMRKCLMGESDKMNMMLCKKKYQDRTEKYICLHVVFRYSF